MVSEDLLIANARIEWLEGFLVQVFEDSLKLEKINDSLKEKNNIFQKRILLLEDTKKTLINSIKYSVKKQKESEKFFFYSVFFIFFNISIVYISLFLIFFFKFKKLFFRLLDFIKF